MIKWLSWQRSVDVRERTWVRVSGLAFYFSNNCFIQIQYLLATPVHHMPPDHHHWILIDLNQMVLTCRCTMSYHKRSSLNSSAISDLGLAFLTTTPLSLLFNDLTQFAFFLYCFIFFFLNYIFN